MRLWQVHQHPRDHVVVSDEAVCDNDTFFSSGALLLSANTFGQDFHIFRVLPHPMCPSLGSVHHLYTLHRGETMATVTNDNDCFEEEAKNLGS